MSDFQTDNRTSGEIEGALALAMAKFANASDFLHREGGVAMTDEQTAEFVELSARLVVLVEGLGYGTR